MSDTNQHSVRDTVRWLRGWHAPDDAERGTRRRIERFHEWADDIERLIEQYGTALRLLNGVIDAGVETWHTVVNDEPHLASWLGLTTEQYAAWAEGSATGLVECEASIPASSLDS